MMADHIDQVETNHEKRTRNQSYFKTMVSPYKTVLKVCYKYILNIYVKATNYFVGKSTNNDELMSTC